MKFPLFPLLFTAILSVLIGVFLGRSGLDERVAQSVVKASDQVQGAIMRGVTQGRDMDARIRMLAEYPQLVRALSRGGGFGGHYSALVARDMFTREGRGLAEARRLLEAVKMGPRTWLLRLPIVNAALFETDAGLVLVDTGMGVGGPALLKKIRSLSKKPLHTVIYTHGHVDHAYGAWAFLEAGERPQIIAHENLPRRFERYLRLRGSLARYMSQPEDSMPDGRDGLVWPTRTFSDRLELDIGGERFVLQHHRAETDDQLYVWVPGRKALASADYYQGFLPNAGNGKRVQRHLEEWAFAMREMAGLGAEMLLPGHGEALTDAAVIRDNFLLLAEVLESAVNHAIEGLNQGLRKDQIAASFQLPARLANHPTMDILYVSPQDLVKMVLKRYTGWWDDVPSHWTPSPMEAQAKEIVRLAGGVPALLGRIRELAEDDDLPLACHLVDWAFLAAPEDAAVQQLVLEIYQARILHPASNTQEMLVYIDAMTQAHQLQQSATP